MGLSEWDRVGLGAGVGGGGGGEGGGGGWWGWWSVREG